MRRALFFVFAAALLPPTSSAVTLLPVTPSVVETAGRCDPAIGDVETMTLKINECAGYLAGEHAKIAALASAKPSSKSRGLPDTRTWSIPDDVSKPAAKKLLNLAVTDAVRPRLIEYFAYAAFAAGDVSKCEKLSVLGLAVNCRDEFGNLKTALAAQGEPRELAEACRLPQNDLTPACCDLIAALPDRADPCASLVPGCWRETGMCRAFWDGEVKGDAKACPGVRVRLTPDCKADGCRARQAERVARCEEVAAFARAFKAKDIRLCDSPRCRALMGEAPAVAAEIDAQHLQNPAGAWFLKNGWKPPPLPVEVAPSTAAPRWPAADYKGFVCADPIRSLDNRKAVRSVVAAAESCLADYEAELGFPPLDLTADLDARAEKLARLGLMMETTFSPATRLKIRDR